ATIAAAIQDGTFQRVAPIYVTTDNYIIDGHHGWAGSVADEYIEGKDLSIPVVRVDMPITDALREATTWTRAQGLGAQALGAKRLRVKYDDSEERDDHG